MGLNLNPVKVGYGGWFPIRAFVARLHVCHAESSNKSVPSVICGRANEEGIEVQPTSMDRNRQQTCGPENVQMTGADHAFVVLKTIISKTLEWQCGIWFASLDLTSAFDKVEHGALFAALTAQGIRDGYFDLLMHIVCDT